MESNKSTLLNKLTIVVPTYCRQKYVLRQLNYWEKLPVKLLILDGSPKALEIENLQDSRKNFHYVHSPTSIENRLIISLDYITTEFVVLLSDDEFFLPSALENCVLFLEQNTEYSCCKGLAIGFDVKSNQLLGRPVYPRLLNYSIDSDNPSQRACDHMLNYQMASLWSVQRLIVYGSCVKAVNHAYPYSTAAAVELQFSLVTAFLGKIKVINELMWLRSFENKNIWWSEGNLRIREWWIEKSYSSEHKKFLSSVIYALSFTNLDCIKESDIKKAISAYITYVECKNSLSTLKLLQNTGIKLFKILIPNGMIYFIKKVIHFESSINRAHQSLQEVSESLESKGVKINLKQLENIQKCILNFDKQKQ